MLALFAVFFISVLLAVLTADGRAARIARLNAFASRACDTARTLADCGTEIAERSSAVLAADRRSSVGIDRLLRRSGSRPGAEAEGISEP